MSQYDVAIGLDKSTLNKGAGELYASPTARAKLLQGSQHGTHEVTRKPYSASWDIQGAACFHPCPSCRRPLAGFHHRAGEESRVV
jgi:hypothetical protein